MLAPVGSVQASQAVQGTPTLEMPPPPLSTIHEDQNHQIGQKSTGRLAAQTEDPLSFLPRPDQGSQGSSKVRADRHGTWADTQGTLNYSRRAIAHYTTSQSPLGLVYAWRAITANTDAWQLARAPTLPCTSFHLEIDRDETIISRNDNLNQCQHWQPG